MRRIVLIFAGIGAAIPIILVIANRVELYFNPGVPFTLLLPRYLWPTYIWLLITYHPDGRFWPSDIITWILSILANVVLYAVIGLIVASGWRFISKWTNAGAG